MDENTTSVEQEVTTGTDGAPETSEATTSGSNYSETFRNLESKMKENPHYDPSEEEMEAFHKMRDEGEKPETETEEVEDTEGKKEEVKKTEPAPELADVLKKVGAKNPAELGTKVDGLLNQLEKFNNERGATGSKIKEFEGKIAQYEGSLQNQHNLLAGVLSGDQRAIEQAKGIMAKAGVQINAKANYQDIGFTDADLENAVDAPLIKGLVGKIQSMEARLQEVQTRADDVVKNVTTTANQDKAWNGVVNEFASVGDKFFAESGLRASAVRELMGQWKSTGQMPEALAPLKDLAEFADREGVNLEKAYKLRDYDELPKRLSKTGKPPVAKASVGLSDKLGNAAQSKTHREFSGSQLEGMFRSGEFPESWKSGGMMDPAKIPTYAQDYFANLAT
jgi:hypothetical protein